MLHYILEIFFPLYKQYNVIFILDLFVARARGDCGNFPSRLPLLSSFYRRNNVTTFIKAMSKSNIQKGPIFMTVSVSSISSKVPTPLKKIFFFSGRYSTSYYSSAVDSSSPCNYMITEQAMKEVEGVGSRGESLLSIGILLLIIKHNMKLYLY